MNRSSVYIIAEIGVNHDGSVETARELIDAAVAAKVDAVKFQGFSADRLATAAAPKANYQLEHTDRYESQQDMLRRLELPKSVFVELHEYSRNRGVDFLMTPFDPDYVQFINAELDLPRFKLGSGALTNGPLLLAAARTKKPIILSTGFSDLKQISAALAVLAFGYDASAQSNPSQELLAAKYLPVDHIGVLKEKVTLMHCTSDYPAKFDQVNLQAIRTIFETFGLAVGYSDHTPGTDVPALAVAVGAVAIEKHLTLDRGGDGPDHAASITPDELETLVASVRLSERVMGSPDKVPMVSELNNQIAVYQSLVAARPIAQGESFSEDNLTVMRPGSGISAMLYWDWIGRKAHRSYAAHEIIEDMGS